MQMTIQPEPHERLLNRFLGPAQNREYVDALDRAFSALVNEATWVFARCWESAGDSITAHVLLILGRHIIEMTDAIHNLLLSGASRPAQLQLRSAFEALLYLDFITKDDSDRRALAYVVGSRLWSLRYSKRMIEGSEERKQFIAEIGADPLITQEIIDNWISSDEEVRRAEEFLETGDLAEIYDRFKAFGKRKPFWYQALDGKPANLRDLALHLNRGGQFVLNDMWSRTAHPDLLGTQLEQNSDGEYDRLRMLRDGEHMSDIAWISASFLRQAMEILLGRFRPDEAPVFRGKYFKEFVPLFAELGPTDVIRLRNEEP